MSTDVLQYQVSQVTDTTLDAIEKQFGQKVAFITIMVLPDDSISIGGNLNSLEGVVSLLGAAMGQIIQGQGEFKVSGKSKTN